MGLVTLPLWIRKLTAKALTHWSSILEFIDTLEFILEFNGQLKGEISSAFANVFKLTVGRSLKFVAVKKFGRELGNDDHNTKWTAR